MKKIVLLCFITFSALKLFAQPVMTITFNGSTTTPISVCTGASLTASGCSACITYQWKLNGANIGSNTSYYYATQSGAYTCTGTNASGTSTSNTITITILTASPVSISAGGPVSFCNNPQQVTLTATNGTGFSYQWYKRTHGSTITINGATSQTYLPPNNANEVYAVHVTNSQGCISVSNEITVSYFTAPPPPQTLTVFDNQTWICPNGVWPDLYLTSITGCSYQWKLNGNAISTNCSGGYSACIGPQFPGIYSCTVTNVCGAVSSDSVTITQPPTAVMAITGGNPTSCTGSVQFSITNSGSLPPITTYQWKKNGTAIANATYPTYNAVNAGNYTCDVKIPQCATVTPAAVTVYTTPNIITSDPVTFCSSGATLTACPAGSTCQWKKNGVTIAGATGGTYYATSTGSYTCVITPPGCTSATSNSLSITSGVSNPIITAPNGYDDCNGGTITLSVSNVNGGTYQWGTQPSGDLIGEISSSLNATSTNNYYCRVTESCGTSTANAPATVRILPDLNSYLYSSSGQGDVCGSAGVYVDTYNYSPIPYSFQWLKNDTAINGATWDYYNANQPGVYTCDISIPGCANSYPVGYPSNSTFTITNIVSPIPSNTAITPAGTATICTGHSATLSVPACTGCSYKFYKKIGSSYSLVYYNSNVYVIPLGYASTDNYYARIENACNSVNTPVDTIIAVQTFTATVTPAGPTSFCGPVSVVLNSNTGTGFTYQWLNNYTVITGATSASYTATQPGFYKVVITKTDGCNATSFGTSVTTFSSLPATTVTAGEPISFCSGGSVLLSSPGVSYTTQQWKKDGIDIAGAIYYSYTATASGSYTVVVTNGCGSSTSSPVTVTVNPLPSATITPAGSTTFCSGGSVVLNAPVAANRTYQWKKGTNLISGATLSSYTATTGGSYKVIVTNTVTGCSKTTGSPTVVTVNALPSATITPQGPTTFCAGGSVVLKANTGTGLTYKWKKGSNFISGATLLNYTATVGGTYKVEVTNSNGCSKLSAGVVVSVPCKLDGSESESAFDAKVFPNPNSGEFTIKFSTKPSSPIQIELTDEIGKVVKRFEANDETVVIKESNLASGIYCLTVRDKNEVVVKKINIVK
jgi:hypothetical protein